VHKVFKERNEILELPVQLVLLDQRVIRVTLVLLDHKVKRVIQEQLDLLVLLDHKVKNEIRVISEILETLVQQEPLVLHDLKVM
jgi:hypothetical protein